MTDPTRSTGTTTVLYILGSGRNGSTLLATILASAPGAMTVGELHWLWDRGLVDDRLCGCGEPTRSCPYWTDVLETRTNIGKDDGARIAALRDSALSGFRPFRLVTRKWKGRVTPDQQRFMTILKELYAHVAPEGVVVVDSSKRPTYGLLFSRIDSLDVRVVHLVRDSRAVAFSWLRKKPNPDIPGGGYMKRHSALVTSAGWDVWNFLSEWFWINRRDRYMRIRYEDFIADPEAVVTTIATFAGIDPSGYTFLDHDTIGVGTTHTISGNPSRFSTGPVQLKPDDEWKRRMRPIDRWITTLLTWPELLRYGYKLRTRR